MRLVRGMMFFLKMILCFEKDGRIIFLLGLNEHYINHEMSKVKVDSY